MKRIRVDFVEQSIQRYPTVGDYVECNAFVNFRITDMHNPIYSAAILLHELVEKILNDRDGIPDSDVDAWDFGEGADLPDPGLDPRAPYHRNHMIADAIERSFIALAGEDWVRYEEAIDKLFM
jgi:hypothetical protein